MSGLIFSLRAAPAQRLDLSPLIPQNLAGKTVAEIERIELQTTRVRVAAGDVFRIRVGDPDAIVIEGGAERFDRVGAGMASGSIRVEGEVGVEAGRRMSGGQLTIRGDAGPFAGSGMKGGTLDIEGDAGERLGGPLSGETIGMSGGVLHVLGDAGERAGDRLRRGFILIEGRAGAYAGSRMIAGTLAIGGEAGELPGYLMGRGTIMLGRGATLSRRPSATAANMSWSRRDFSRATSPRPAPSWRTCSAGRSRVWRAIWPPSARERSCSQGFETARSDHSRSARSRLIAFTRYGDARPVDARGIDVQTRCVGALKKGAAQIRAACVRLA